jgi:hypothetical protein
MDQALQNQTSEQFLPQTTYRGKPQPKLGISPAKQVLSDAEGTRRLRRSEKMLKRIRKNIYRSSLNLAPLRLGGSNPRIREPSTFRNI